VFKPLHMLDGGDYQLFIGSATIRPAQPRTRPAPIISANFITGWGGGPNPAAPDALMSHNPGRNKAQMRAPGSSCMSPTRVAGPVMRIEKSSPIEMFRTPPGMWTETSASTRPSLRATEAAALELLPEASV